MISVDVTLSAARLASETGHLACESFVITDLTKLQNLGLCLKTYNTLTRKEKHRSNLAC